jgi:hypothetical protein
MIGGMCDEPVKVGSSAGDQRSNRAMDSTCAVCGNISITPAALKRKPCFCTRMRGYMELFKGYGESMIDYNHNATYLGVGVSLLDWY